MEIPDPSPQMAKQPHERSILSEENGGGESPKVDVKRLRWVQLVVSVKHKQCHLRLVEFFEKWKTISSDHNILDIIQGYQIVEKNNTPHQIRHPKETKFPNVEEQFIDPEINRLLERGVIVPSCHEPGEYTSTIFLRPKPDGSQRLLLNLRFNEHVAYHQFRMESVKSAKQMMKPGCYMPLVHLKDTYYSVHVEQEYQKYLKLYRKGKLYQYTCLWIALLVHSHYSQNC